MEKTLIQRSLESTPAVITLEETYDASIGSSTEITLNSDTTLIEVSAIDKTILLNWGATSASTSVFDEVINLNSTRQFLVPVDTSTKVLFTKVNFIEQEAGAVLCVVEK
ncbi:hypothetical protein LCGC14_0995830 [marine sediment metagenome]|uniref:Uncharacterized protein n=1 Tax=marine sediment metagenome TaxID=412755 RepID=A0A0F9QMX0_9ZZZZ